MKAWKSLLCYGVLVAQVWQQKGVASAIEVVAAGEGGLQVVAREPMGADPRRNNYFAGDAKAGDAKAELGDLPAWSEPLLAEGRLQEVIWLLEDDNCHEQADLVKKQLYTIMSEGPYEDPQPLGMGGATKPQAVHLTDGVIGVFKAVSHHPSANHQAEVAAYLLDQKLDLRLVPMTILREIDGSLGSLQYFVKDATPARKIKDFQRSYNLNVFDYLINNKDRNGDNLIRVMGREVAIDHGLAMRGVSFVATYLKHFDKVLSTLGHVKDPIRQQRIQPSTHLELYKADKRVLTRLDDLTLADLHDLLGAYLSRSRIQEINDHRVKLLKRLKKAGYF